MKIELLIDGHVVNTQIVSEALYDPRPTVREAKRIALNAALKDGAIKLSQSLQVKLRAYDVMGQPIEDE
jgi:hypothetical protein